MRLRQDPNRDRGELLHAAAMSVAAGATVAIVLTGLAGTGASADDQRCEGCYNFQPSNACKSVQAEISPSGWCGIFAPKS
jgi:hypothetical protein